MPKSHKDVKAGCALTTGQLARYMGCSPRVVQSWIDSGQLKGFRLPTLRNKQSARRVSVKAALEFANRHGIDSIDLDRLGEAAGLRKPSGPTFLVVSANPTVATAFIDACCDATRAGGLFQAGVLIRSRTFDAVVLDGAIGMQECASMVTWIREHCQGSVIGVLVYDDFKRGLWLEHLGAVLFCPHRSVREFPGKILEKWRALEV